MIIFVFFIFFFSILTVSMATAAILKKNQPLKIQLHMAYDIPTRFHKVWSRHLREMCRTNFWQKKERRIIIIRRNGANTICLPNFAWATWLTTSMYWPCYCTVHVSIVIHMCDSMWSFWLEASFLAFLYICIVVGDPVIKRGSTGGFSSH